MNFPFSALAVLHVKKVKDVSYISCPSLEVFCSVVFTGSSSSDRKGAGSFETQTRSCHRAHVGHQGWRVNGSIH